MISPDILNWQEILEVVHGQLIQGTLTRPVSEISTDTRTLKAGALFMALKGPHFNGHAFLSQAFERGASAALISEPLSPGQVPSDGIIIMVKDTLWALGDLAGFWRSKFPVTLIGISGSNGKTTAKEMLAAILDLEGPILKNPGNLNNWIGLPMSLFSLNQSHRFAVMEMGMNHLGEITRLCQIARPSVGLLTNIGPAHLEGLGSMEAIARAKGELFDSLNEKDWAIVNQDDFRIRELARSCRAQKRTFGQTPEAEVRAEKVQLSPEGIRFHLMVSGESREIFLPMQGEHNVGNALGAAAAALILGLPLKAIQEGLAGIKPPAHRLQIKTGLKGSRLIDDAYNANPTSMKAALKTFQSLRQGQRAGLALADMLELGPEAQKAHQEIGREVGNMGVDYLLAFGPLSQEILSEAMRGSHPPKEAYGTLNHSEVIPQLESLIRDGDILLIKGSHGMHLETVVRALEEKE
jgi:UDP-N-acetylmuramoyl-tripeptide--D-alanyl-D-alanine ligase